LTNHFDLRIFAVEPLNWRWSAISSDPQDSKEGVGRAATIHGNHPKQGICLKISITDGLTLKVLGPGKGFNMCVGTNNRKRKAFTVRIESLVS